MWFESSFQFKLHINAKPTLCSLKLNTSAATAAIYLLRPLQTTLSWLVGIVVLGTVQNSSTIANAIKPFGELEHVPQLATISVTSTFLLKRLSEHIRVSRFNQPQAQCLFGTVFRFSTFDSGLSSSQLLFGGSSVWLPSHSGCGLHTQPLFFFQYVYKPWSFLHVHGVVQTR